MKKYNLSQALLIIAEDVMMRPEFITSISFEDGSGQNFNYSTISGNYFAHISNTGEVVRNTWHLSQR